MVPREAVVVALLVVVGGGEGVVVLEETSSSSSPSVVEVALQVVVVVCSVLVGHWMSLFSFGRASQGERVLVVTVEESSRESVPGLEVVVVVVVVEEGLLDGGALFLVFWYCR